VSRFLDNCCLPKEQRTAGEITLEEINAAEIEIITRAQQEAFGNEYLLIAKGKERPSSSKLLHLRPLIDQDGILRCDGRLKYAEFIPYETRFPITLPRRHWVTTLFIKHYHQKDYHTSGTNQTLADLTLRFWIIVLVVSPDSPRGQWPLGRVIEVHTGEDGRVRVAKIQVGRNVITRSVSKLCPLEVCD